MNDEPSEVITEPQAKEDKRKTRWSNATPEERAAHGEKVRVGRAAAKAKREADANQPQA